MQVTCNSILNSYLLDYDIDIDNVIANPNVHAPKRIKSLANKIKSINRVFTHKAIKKPWGTDENKTELECSLNEIWFSEGDLGVKKISIPKYLNAYLSSVFVLEEALRKKHNEMFVIYFNFFISKEISHDLRYHLKRENENWVSKNFENEPLATGLLRVITSK